ncbi:MAG: PqqD family protein [Oscillospiraceae bacterium]|nr:PqqD family protein [Oscillospiraceae bacterium]
MKHNQPEENYLERCPVRPEWIAWSADENGIVTLDIENKGLANRLAQKLLKKPKVSHIHLDEIGSFVWPMIDGQKTIMDMGEPMEEHFGDLAKPTYERLAKFFQILESYGFVEWKTE